MAIAKAYACWLYGAHRERMRATTAMAARNGCVFLEPLASAPLGGEEARRRRRENALPVVVRCSQAPLQGAGSA